MQLGFDTTLLGSQNSPQLLCVSTAMYTRIFLEHSYIGLALVVCITVQGRVSDWAVRLSIDHLAGLRGMYNAM